MQDEDGVARRLSSAISSILKPAKKHGRRFLNPVETRVGGLSMILKVLPLYLSNREEKTPRIAPGPFRTDAAVYRERPRSGLRVTWIGHSSMLLEIDGATVLIDPVWDERASPASWFGPKRFFEAPLKLDELPPIDVVLISHDHYDHLGKRTIQSLSRLEAARNAQWVSSLGVGRLLQGFGVGAGRIVELNWTESTTIQTRDGSSGSKLRVTALPARHFSGRAADNRFETLWSSFVLEGAQHRVYYGADSGMWEGFSEIGKTFGPFDLTMLEIGAFHPLWKDIHMGPDGAAEAYAAIGRGGLLMPIHWGLFDLALHGWRQPIERMTHLAGQQKIPLWSPEPGKPTEVVLGQEHRSEWWRS